jgi:hypothetical protein
MPTVILKPASIISASGGWATTTTTQIRESDNVRSPGGAAGAEILVELDELPSDYYSLGATAQIIYEGVASGAANRPKSVVLTLLGDEGATLGSGTTGTIGTTEAVHTFNVTSLPTGPRRLRALVQEGSGMADTVTVLTDQLAISLTYNLAAVPTAITSVTSAGATDIKLTYTNVSNEEGYRIHRSTVNGFTPTGTTVGEGTCIGVRGADVTVFYDITTAPATTYYYRIEAFSAAGSTLSAQTSRTTTSSSHAAAHTVVDDFENATYSSSLWTGSSTGAYSVVNGLMRVACANGSNQIASAQLTGTTVNFASSEAVVELVNPSGQQNIFATFRFHPDASYYSDFVGFSCDGTSLHMDVFLISNIVSRITLTYSATSHRWLKLSCQAGEWTWWTAPDSGGVPGTWTARRVASTHPLTACPLFYRGGRIVLGISPTTVATADRHAEFGRLNFPSEEPTGAVIGVRGASAFATKPIERRTATGFVPGVVQIRTASGWKTL